MTRNNYDAEWRLNQMQKALDALRNLESDGCDWAEDKRFEIGEKFREYVKELETDGYAVTHNSKFEWHVKGCA